MAEPKSDYVKENPVDEVLYPSYDEAGAQILDLYSQYGSDAKNHVQGVVETRDIAQNQAIQTAMTTAPGTTTQGEAFAATDDLSQIIDLVSTELAIMEQSRENHIAMTQNMMTNYVSALQEGLPYLEQYVDARLESLDGGGGSGGGPSGPSTDGTDQDVDDGGLSDEDKDFIANELGMTVEEAFPNVDNPDDDFDWDEGSRGTGGQNNYEILASIYGTLDNYDYYYEQELRTDEIEVGVDPATGESIFETRSMSGTNPDHYQVKFDANGNPILKPIFQTYATIYRAFMAEGASTESAELMTWNKLQTPEFYGPNFDRLSPEDKGALQNFVRVNTDMYHIENGRQDQVQALTAKEAEGMGMHHEALWKEDEDSGNPVRKVPRRDDVAMLQNQYGTDADDAGTLDLAREGVDTDDFDFDKLPLTESQLEEWRALDDKDEKEKLLEKWAKDHQQTLDEEAWQDPMARTLRAMKHRYTWDRDEYRDWVDKHGREMTPDEFIEFAGGYGSEQHNQSFLDRKEKFGRIDDPFRATEQWDKSKAEWDLESQTLDAYQTAKGLGFMGINPPQQQSLGSVGSAVGSAIGDAGAMAANAAKGVTQGIRKVFGRDDLDQMYAQALAEKKKREQEALIQLAADNRAMAALVGAEPPPPKPVSTSTYDPSQASDWANFKIF